MPSEQIRYRTRCVRAVRWARCCLSVLVNAGTGRRKRARANADILGEHWVCLRVLILISPLAVRHSLNNALLNMLKPLGGTNARQVQVRCFAIMNRQEHHINAPHTGSMFLNT